MIDRKKLCKKALHPPVWLLISLTVISTAVLMAVFVKGWDTHPIAYGSYVLAFYTLTVVCIRCVPFFPRIYRAVKQKVYDNRYSNGYMTDMAVKTHVSLYVSLTVNLLYAAVNIVSVILYRSAWFGVLAGYYVILAIMRFLLLRYVNKNAIGEKRVAELRRSRLCGMILMTVNLVLPSVVLMMLYRDKGYEYHGMLIYVMAMYTFYVTIHAIINIVKYRKYESPVVTTAKAINLCAALVSVLSLETAMLSQFGADMQPENRRIMIAATGGGVSVVVVALSVYMIVRATVEIRKEERKNNGKSK